MDANYREIEKKFLVTNAAKYNTLEKILVEHYELAPAKVLFADTIDYYWEVPGKGDFVRLRNSWGQTLEGIKKTLKEITVKHKDKGTNTNRLEINVEVDKIMSTKELLNVVLGPNMGSIRKQETVLFVSDSLVVSLCEINKGRVYIEVEGPHVNTVNAHCRALEKLFTWEIEPKNLFELYIEKEKDESNSFNRADKVS